ncbi:ABC transporter substrate-binding protein [Rhodobacter capsulatus]|uniref:ABC transporter substrate-binding protein n=1 Tax=Rhodobacter capsulatus TaxID=1061 RepID=UPI0040287A5F
MTLLRSLALAALLSGTALSAAADPVTLRYLPNHGGLSPFELAAELGYYDAAGITLENLGYATGGPETLIALAGGSADIGSAATPAVLNAIAGGNDFVAVFPTNGINDSAQSIFYVRDDSPIRTIADLPGHTIAVNTLGAHLDYVVREALHQKGLPEDAANLVVVPGPQLDQVLRAGQVDVSAFGYWQTTFEGAARQKGGLRAVFDDTDVLGEIAGGFAVLRRDWIDAHPAEARAFVDGATKALEYARSHPAETKAIFARVLQERGENPEVAQYFAGYGVREGGLATTRDVQFWIDILTREGKIAPGKIAAADILYQSAEAPAPATN